MHPTLPGAMSRHTACRALFFSCLSELNPIDRLPTAGTDERCREVVGSCVHVNSIIRILMLYGLCFGTSDLAKVVDAVDSKSQAVNEGLADVNWQQLLSKSTFDNCITSGRDLYSVTTSLSSFAVQHTNEPRPMSNCSRSNNLQALDYTLVHWRRICLYFH